MEYSEKEPDSLERLSDEADEKEHVATELFPGDLGQLPMDARRVLVQLLSGPSLDAKRHTKLWPVLSRHEALIRSRLAELFLELVLDRDMQVAFTRQADTGDLETPTLLRRTNLTFIDSVLMLYLRQQLTEAETQGLRAVVSATDMREQLGLYEQSINTDRAGFDKRVNAAIEKAKKNSILSRIKDSDERYEVAPTLKLLFSAEQIGSLLRQYRSLLAEDVPSNEGHDNA